MVWTIARHEWRLMARATATKSVIAGAIVVIGLALALGSVRADAERRDRAGLREWASSQVPALWPGSAEVVANERGTYIVAPLPALAAVTVGYSDLYPAHYRITARLRESQVRGDQVEHPLSLLTGHVDLAFVAVHLVPLIVLALVFDLTAGERQSGTLRMVLSRPVPLRAVVLGKLIARSAIVVLCVAVASFGTLGITDWTADTLVRLALWVGAVLVYAAAWIALAVFVDARGRSASNNAMVLAAVWLMVVVLLPAAINLIGGLVHPAPSRIEVSTAVRAASHAAAATSSRLLGRFLEDHPSVGVGREGMAQFATLQEARESEIDRRLQPVLASIEARVAERRALVATLQYLSPAMLLQATLADIAGTGPVRQQQFQDQAASFQRAWKAFFAPRLLDARPMTVEDYAAMPAFTFREEPIAPIAQRVAGPFVALTALTAALLLAGLRRYASSPMLT